MTDGTHIKDIHIEQETSICTDDKVSAKDLRHNEGITLKFPSEVNRTISTEVQLKEDLSTIHHFRASSLKPIGRSMSVENGTLVDYGDDHHLFVNTNETEKNLNVRKRPMTLFLGRAPKISLPIDSYTGLSDGISTLNEVSKKNKKSAGLAKGQTIVEIDNRKSVVSNIQTLMYESSFTKAFDLIHDKAMVVGYDSSPTLKKKKRRPDALRKMLQKHANYKVDTGTRAFFRLMKDLQRAKSGPFGRIKYRLLKCKSAIRNTVKDFNIRDRLRMLVRPIQPDSTFRFIWGLIILIFIILDLIFLPFSIAFSDFLQGAQDFFGTYDTLQFVFFLWDIILNFNTAYNFEGNVITDRKKIAIKYLKGWFCIDLISSFPFQTMISAVQGDDADNSHLFRGFRFLRFFKIVRIIRIIKLKRILVRSEEYLDNSTLLNGILSLIKLSMIIFFLAHWCACIWYFIGWSNRNDDNWLAYARVDMTNIASQYVAALYYIITTMLTVGFGDIVPISLEERIFSIFVMVLGGGVFGYTLNSIANIIQALEDEKTTIRRKIYGASRYMQQQGVNKQVQTEVKKYLDFMLEMDSQDKRSEKEILRLLPDHLKSKVDEQINRKFVDENKILTATFSEKVTQKISSRVEGRICSPGELIYGVDDSDFSVFFILKGTVALSYENSTTVLVELRRSHHFGEESFFSNLQRKVVARSQEFTQLLFFKRETILEILKDFPLDGEMFHMTKDNIINYQKHSILGLKCLVCNEPDHVEDSCPRTAYRPDKDEIFERCIEEEKIFNYTFPRRPRARFSAVSKSAELGDAARRFNEVCHIKTCENISPDSYDGDPIGSPNPMTTIVIEEPNSTIREMSNQIQSKKKKVFIFSNAYGDTEVNLADEHRYRTEAILSRVLKNDYQMNQQVELVDGAPFAFDRVKNYEIYFPHNNLTKITGAEAHVRSRKDMSDIDALKNHLGRFFIAVDKKSFEDS